MSLKMKISEIHIEFIKPRDGLVGFASFVINEDIYISSVAIHKKLNGDGYRLTYPSKGNFTICHPINKKTSQEIEPATKKNSQWASYYSLFSKPPAQK